MVRINKRRIFDDKKVRQCKDEVMKRFESLQLRQKQIFPVVNYVDENSVNLQTDNLVVGMEFYVTFSTLAILIN
jgi:uncharacterized protein YcgI (DUF1989 family)